MAFFRGFQLEPGRKQVQPHWNAYGVTNWEAADMPSEDWAEANLVRIQELDQKLQPYRSAVSELIKIKEGRLATAKDEFSALAKALRPQVRELKLDTHAMTSERRAIIAQFNKKIRKYRAGEVTTLSTLDSVIQHHLTEAKKQCQFLQDEVPFLQREFVSRVQAVEEKLDQKMQEMKHMERKLLGLETEADVKVNAINQELEIELELELASLKTPTVQVYLAELEFLVAQWNSGLGQHCPVCNKIFRFRRSSNFESYRLTNHHHELDPK